MDEFYIKSIISSLIDIYGFHVEEYNMPNSDYKEWIAIKMNEETAFAVIFSDIENYEIKARSAMDYMIYKGCSNIILNNIIMSDRDEDFNYILQDSFYNKIALNTSRERVFGYTKGAENLATFIQSIMDKPKEKAEVKENSKHSITYILIGINIIFYILSAYLSGSIFNIDPRVLIVLGAKYNPLIQQGQYYRLITAMFLHGGLLHIFLNMYALKATGEIVESIYGKTKFIIIYFLSGIVSSLASYIFSDGVSVGASGAIFGLLGACLIFASKMKEKIGKSFLTNILSVIAINIFIGITMPNIDNFGHIGGLLGGILISAILFKDNY